MDLNKRAQLVRQWVYQDADQIHEGLKNPLIVKTKSNPKDLVTNLDQSTEKFIRSQIKTHFPNDKILGEEGGQGQIDNLQGPVWIIDPIDGTTNFVCQHNHFAIMVAFALDGDVQLGAIYDVMNDDYFSAVKGQGIQRNGQAYQVPYDDLAISESLIALNRQILLDDRYHAKDLVSQSLGIRYNGSAGLEILNVLKGELSLYAALALKPWDLAAGVALVNESPLKLTQLDGQALNLMQANASVIAYPSAYQTFRDLYDRSVQEGD
ncbi:inositol monophosphatase family protein [Aerococcus urinae]|uniref:inositol monophosphatase family protein n=1 Tax=Aerococcus urinae TaxID=1376 RepID=UPI0018E0CFA1|nr:inositol monophosphatase family protein [Aerococcus urinae]